MTDRKKLIEVALPLEAINKASAREKSIRHGHPSTLHLWWARRPLAACRAVIFTSLVDDPNNPNAPEAFVEACKKLPKGKNAAEEDTTRQRLFDFIERLVTWEATTDEEILEKARELIRLCTDGNPPPLLDPFAGGGSIPLEAQRLGLEAHASDLNPVAVMINKAMIEIPPLFKDMPPVNPKDREKIGSRTSWKGAAGLAADVRYYGEWMKEQAWEKIGHLYPKINGEIVIAWIWSRTVDCPNPVCKSKIPLARSFDLCRKKGNNVWLEPIIDRKSNGVGFILHQDTKSKRHSGTVDRRGAKCLACSTPVSLDYIRNEGQSGRMSYKLLAIVSEGDKGRNYSLPTNLQEEVAKSVVPSYSPEIPLVGKTRVSVPLYGIETHADLYTNRQMVALNTFSDLISSVREEIKKDSRNFEIGTNNKSLRDLGKGNRAYSEAVSVYLTFAICRLANRLATTTVWNVSGQKIEQVFARQAIPMTWDFPEANPFSNSTGNWAGNLGWIGKVLENIDPRTFGKAYQENSMQLNSQKKFLIATDPPYYDNICYADLSDFFYIWQRRSLRDIYPDLYTTILTPKEKELIASTYGSNSDDYSAKEYFENGLKESFINIKDIHANKFPMTLYYAFKQEEITENEGSVSTGWETMLEGLIQAGFTIIGTWPMRTERNTGIKADVNALASSILLVCRSNQEKKEIISKRELFNILRNTLPKDIIEMQSGNIAPVDLAQASIGPGMAVYTRYEKVLEPDGSKLTVRAALQLINQVLDEYLAEQEGEMGQASRFAVAWFEQYAFDVGPFGQADVLARAKNTSVEGMANSGILEAEAGKVRLLRWDELDPGQVLQSGMVWAATHLLIERLNTHGETGVAELLASLPPDLAADARQLAYRLYSIADRKGWSALARDYNTLVVSWNESQEQAQDIKKNKPQQGRLFGE